MSRSVGRPEVPAVEAEVEAGSSRVGVHSRASRDSKADSKVSRLGSKDRLVGSKDRGAGSKPSKARSSCRSRSTISSRSRTTRPRLARSLPKARSRPSKELLSRRPSLRHRFIRRRLRFTNLARLGFRAHIRPSDLGSSLSRLILHLAR